MPDYKPLTQAEKDAIIARHHYFVDEMNKVLDNALHNEDEAILAKLDDPKEIAAYRLGEEHKARNRKRDQIFDSLRERYGPSPITNNPMSRTLRYSFKLGDTEADRTYNEKLYQEYLTNPDKIVYREFNKVLDLNPNDIFKLGEDKQKLAEFYMNNTALCENAYAFHSVLNNDEAHTSKALKEALVSIKKPMECINHLGNIVKTSTLDAVACPSLTPEQAAMVWAARPLFEGSPYPDLVEEVNGKLGHLDKPSDYFQKFVDRGINVDDKDFFAKYKAVRRDPVTHEEETVSFDAIFEQNDPNVTIQERGKDEIFQIKGVNRVFQDKFAEQFQNRVAMKLNQMIFDVKKLEDDRQGGWWERNVFRSTSPQWTNFIQGLKNYNDPNHPDYLRKDILRPKAQAYMDHKRAQGYASLADMKGTSLKRGTLCEAVIETCDELDMMEQAIKQDIDIEVNTGLKGKVGLAIEAAEVDIEDGLPFYDGYDNEMAMDKSKEKDLDDVGPVVDDPNLMG